MPYLVKLFRCYSDPVKGSHLDYCGARNLCRRIGYSDGSQFGQGPGSRRLWEERGSEFITPRQNRKKCR